MGVLDWGFRCTVKVHQNEKGSISLKSERGDVKFSDLTKELTLVDPDRKLWLNPLLFNGSLQTLYYTSWDHSQKFQVYYGRETFNYSDGGICSLDWVIPKHENYKELYFQTFPKDSPRLPPRTRFFTTEERLSLYSKKTEAPIVAICHGLGGGSHETITRNFAENMAKNYPGWDVVVLNSRGCCRTKLTTGTIFNAGATNDIGDVLKTFKNNWPDRPVYLCGFSFGASLVANFLGTPEAADLVACACAVSMPFDYVDSAYHIEQSLTGKYILSPAMARYLAKIVINNKKSLLECTDYIDDAVLKKLKEIKNCSEFHDLITCKTTHHVNASEYYRELSPVNRILDIKTPFMMLSSTDDPAVSVRLPIADTLANPYLLLVETDLGGHTGHVKLNGDFWCVEVAEQFFQKFHQITV